MLVGERVFPLFPGASVETSSYVSGLFLRGGRLLSEQLRHSAGLSAAGRPGRSLQRKHLRPRLDGHGSKAKPASSQ